MLRRRPANGQPISWPAVVRHDSRSRLHARPGTSLRALRRAGRPSDPVPVPRGPRLPPNNTPPSPATQAPASVCPPRQQAERGIGCSSAGMASQLIAQSLHLGLGDPWAARARAPPLRETTAIPLSPLVSRSGGATGMGLSTATLLAPRSTRGRTACVSLVQACPNNVQSFESPRKRR